MFIVTLPIGETAGRVRINFKECLFQRKKSRYGINGIIKTIERIRYRLADTEEWSSWREVLDVQPVGEVESCYTGKPIECEMVIAADEPEQDGDEEGRK